MSGGRRGDGLRQQLDDSRGGLKRVVREHGFSFRCGGKESETFLSKWRLRKQRKATRKGFVLHTVRRTDPKTGLAVVQEIKEYTRFPVIEWGLRFRNTSARKTPIIEDVRSLDLTLELGNLPYLHHWTGDYCMADGYEPFKVALAHGEQYRFAPLGGRPTNRAWPYYNLECPDEKRGVIVVVGWSGQWASSFHGLSEGKVRVTAGQELTHFCLMPGEEVRTPLSLLMFYRGDMAQGQNLWRRWMIEHNLPRPGGKLPAPILPAYSGRWFDEMGAATEENQIGFIERYRAEGIQIDYWWMDAGWYPCWLEHRQKNAWWVTGTWEPDRKRFPKGLRAVADHAHRHGIGTIVWFEPERVRPGTWLAKERPHWLLTGTKREPRGPANAWETFQRQEQNSLLDLGNSRARRWLIERVSSLIRSEGIDLYRQDCNVDPLPFWRANDAPDRQGITEIRYVEGYLKFWKTLRKRFPNMLIDSCASGGRRNDLETMRLSVPLHKTDYNYDDNTAKQAFHHTLNSWLPYFGAYVLPVDTVDPYAFRSSLAPMTMLTYDLRRRDVDWSKLKALAEEWRRLTATGYFYGDYYPLTPYNRDETQWIAWQHHRDDLDAGLVQAFRRKDCPVKELTLPLRGLDPEARYEIIEAGSKRRYGRMCGRDLMEVGLTVSGTVAPQAVLMVYERVRKRSRP